MAEEERVFKVKGMSCQHCVKAIKEEVGKLSGVSGVKVDLAGQEVLVSYAAGQVSLDQVKGAIEEAGYHIAD